MREVRQKERKEYREIREGIHWKTGLALLAVMLTGLTGCGGTVASLGGTSWKITNLEAPDGTTYDEMSYDTIIGATIYQFGEDGKMRCTVGTEDAGETTYQYTYTDGEVSITSGDLDCRGTVKGKEMKLRLGEQGTAVLTRQS